VFGNSHSRKAQLQVSTLIATLGGGAAVAAGAYAILVEQFDIRVRSLDLSFPDLPPAFDGYTILHLSDLHLTQLARLERRLMDLISQREVDTCVVTGDITQDPRASDIFRRVCSAIRRRDTIYAVLGNSEHKPWLETQVLADALSFEGMRLLVNSSDVIRRGDDSITVVGVDDAYFGHADIDAAFRGVDPGGFTIFLTHSPSLTPQGIERGADLILAGHTHGGQVRLPFLGPIWTHMRANRKLNDGLYPPDRLRRLLHRDSAHTVLFVNRGVGTSKLHIRFLCPPEIAYITLHRAS
jgi:predicted MPP superfamily phosphohydrolase